MTSCAADMAVHVQQPRRGRSRDAAAVPAVALGQGRGRGFAGSRNLHGEGQGQGQGRQQRRRRPTAGGGLVDHVLKTNLMNIHADVMHADWMFDD